MSRYIVFEGLDGLGKTTQLLLLKGYYESKNIKVHTTKALGGDGESDFQNKIRDIILSNEFPKEKAILEEELFAISDMKATEKAIQFLKDNENSIVLKDRGLVSHLCYAAAKGMDLRDITRIFTDIAQKENFTSIYEGVHYLVFIPDNIEWLQKRIQDRNKTDGTKITDRLENYEFQKSVLNHILTAVEKGGLQANLPTSHIQLSLIKVKEFDSPNQVMDKVKEVLNKEVEGLGALL